MYALILSARFADRPIKLGYNDADGPLCRVAAVHVQTRGTLTCGYAGVAALDLE